MSTTEAQLAAPSASPVSVTPSPQATAQTSQLPLADAVRFLSIDAILRAGEGHQGVPLGMAEIATALFTRHLKFNPADPSWPDRDRFVLSNGHGSLLLYSLLYLTGYAAHRPRPAQDVPRTRFALRGASRVRTGARHRSDHRAARSGHRQRVRHGDRGGVSRGEIRQRAGRSLHVCVRRRRLPAGGHRSGDDFAGRASAGWAS